MWNKPDKIGRESDCGGVGIVDKGLYRVIVEVESYCGTNEVMGGRVGLQASDPSVVHVCVYGRNEVGRGQAGNDNNCLWVTTDNLSLIHI